MFLMVILGLILLIGISVIIYMMPSDEKRPAKKEKREKKARAELTPDPIALAKQKDWEAIAHRWEKQNNALLGDIEKLKGEHKKVGQDVQAQEAQNKDLMEKLTLEKSWREKEQATIDKFKTNEKELKDQIFKTEQDLEKEHSNRIRLDRELQDLKIKFDEVSEEKRQLSIKAMSLETTVNQTNKDIRELKRDNVDLQKKREDIQWVAKSEFDELKKVLQAKEQEITRLKDNG